MKLKNTQYLKVGNKTNVGKVKVILDSASFTTDDGFSHNVNHEKVINHDCEHPRKFREYIGRNTLRCNLCGKEFE